MRLRGEEGLTLVEMLIVVVMLGVITSATTASIITMVRNDQYTEELRQVTDEGRVSIDRVRKELRGGRRVLANATATSGPSHLYWWVDQDQDGLQDLEERVHYCVAPLTSNACVSAGQTGKFRLIRYTDATPLASGVPTAATTLAQTLTSSDVFSGYDPTDVTATNAVDITFALDARNDGRGPQQVVVEGSVRLRNVA